MSQTDDGTRVRVIAHVSGSVYYRLIREARRRGLPDVGTLIGAMLDPTALERLEQARVAEQTAIVTIAKQAVTRDRLNQRASYLIDDEAMQTLATQFASGRRVVEIASDLGVSEMTVRVHAKRLGITRPGRNTK